MSSREGSRKRKVTTLVGEGSRKRKVTTLVGEGAQEGAGYDNDGTESEQESDGGDDGFQDEEENDDNYVPDIGDDDYKEIPGNRQFQSVNATEGLVHPDMVACLQTFQRRVNESFELTVQDDTNPLFSGILKGLDCSEDVLGENSLLQMQTGSIWLQRLVKKMGFDWEPSIEPVPLFALLLLIQISGTSQDKFVDGSSEIMGCGQSYSQLKRIRNIANHVNESNGFKKADLFSSYHHDPNLQGTSRNTAYHPLVRIVMGQMEKSINRRVIQSQPFLRRHILQVRPIFHSFGLIGEVVFALILVQFWLMLRPGMALQVRIEHIEASEEKNSLGLPNYLRVYIQHVKNHRKSMVYRLHSFPEDPETCPVLHVFLLLKKTGWRRGYLFKRPFSTRTGLTPEEFSEMSHIPSLAFGAFGTQFVSTLDCCCKHCGHFWHVSRIFFSAADVC